MPEVKLNKHPNDKPISNTITFTNLISPFSSIVSIQMRDRVNSGMCFSLTNFAADADEQQFTVYFTAKYTEGGSATMQKGLLGDPPASGTLVADATNDSKGLDLASVQVSYVLE